MKILITLILALSLGGCGAWAYIQDKVAGDGAEVSDEALKTAIWTICKGVSIGAIDRYFDTEEKATVWHDLCDKDKNKADGAFTP